MNVTPNKYTMEQILGSIVSKISDDNPMEYLNDMYKSINPMVIQDAAMTLKDDIKSENKKSGTPVNTYLTIGSDSMTRSFYQGNIATLLWLPQYISEVGASSGVPKKDIETTLRVLRSVHLPTINAAREDGDKLSSSSGKSFSSFMAALTGWLSNPTYVGQKQTNEQLKNDTEPVMVKTNLEIVRFLTSVALGSFPSIPFAAYYLGSINTDDPMDLAERLSQKIDFRTYMSDESIVINQPKIVVQYEMTPIVGMIGHPLATTILGHNDQDNNFAWHGVFIETEEFTKLCQKGGFTTKLVKKYMLSTQKKKHEENLLQNVPIAMFINEQVVTKQMYEQVRKEFEIKYTNLKQYTEYQGLDINGDPLPDGDVVEHRQDRVDE